MTQGLTEQNSPRGAAAIGQYLAVARRRKALIAVCLIVPIGIAIFLSAQQSPRYAASAQVLVNQRNLANALTGIPDSNQSSTDDVRLLQTQASVARSPDVASKVIEATRINLSSKTFLEASTATPSKNSDILTFTVERRDGIEAIRLANAYAQAFVGYRRDLDTTSLRVAGERLDRRLAGLDRSNPESAKLADSLEQNKQQIETLEALQTSNATIIRRATEDRQVAPMYKRNVALGVLAGLILAALLAGLREILDTRVRSQQEIEERLGLPMLTQVLPPPRDLKGSLIMLERPGAPEAEAFRVLRLALEFATLDRDVRSVVVTGALQSEGKSTTIANLAVAVARAGRRVVLIDLDLRRPRLRALFDLEVGAGVTDVALGHTTLDDALEDIVIADGAHSVTSNGSQRGGALRVLQSGVLPPNPGEFVASGAVARVIDAAEDVADLVLIDAPPALVVGDALAVSAHVDALFLCVRLPQVRRPVLDDLRKALSTSLARPVGFVLTGDVARPHGYNRGYGYAYAGTDAQAPADVTTTNREPASRA